MKATINGIQLEGAPDEIIEYIRQMDMKQVTMPYQEPYVPYYDPYGKTAPTNRLKWNEWSNRQQKQPQ